MNIGIYIYENAEVLDFAGPFEVFSTASRICTDGDPFRVFLIGESQSVKARNGFEVKTAYTIGNHPDLDVLIVSGGVHLKEMKNIEVLEWIKNINLKTEITASVCTGVFILAAAGVVTNHRVTTHFEDIKDLKIMFPDLDVIENQQWVKDGKIVTSAGISAGIDMSLYLAGLLSGDELAEKTAVQMEYRWSSSSTNSP